LAWKKHPFPLECSCSVVLSAKHIAQELKSCSHTPEIKKNNQQQHHQTKKSHNYDEYCNKTCATVLEGFPLLTVIFRPALCETIDYGMHPFKINPHIVGVVA